MKRNYFLWSIYIIVILLFVEIVGCGGGTTGVIPDPNNNPTSLPTNTPIPNTPQTTGIIGPEGGSLEVTNPDSPLYGVKLEIPEGAVSSPTEFIIGTTPFSDNLPLEEGYQPLGETIYLGVNATLHKFVFLTIPVNTNYNLDDIINVAYDETSGSWAVPMITEENASLNTVKIIINHSLMTDSSSLSSNDNSFTTGCFNIIKTLYYDDIFNTPYFTTNFRIGSGEDDFIANNGGPLLGQYGAPYGACWGFACFSKWYFKNIKPANNIPLGVAYSEDRGTKVACEAYRSQLNAGVILDAVALFSANTVIGDKIMAKTLIHDLKITNKPIILGLYNKDNPIDWVLTSHAALIVSWEPSAFLIYDSSETGYPHRGFLKYENEKLVYDPGYTHNYDAFIPIEYSIFLLNDDMRKIYNENPPDGIATATPTPTPDPDSGNLEVILD